MRKALIITVAMAVGLPTACQKSPQPAASETTASANADAVGRTLQQAAGSGAINCGRVKSQAPNEIKPASDCAMNAAQKKQAFYVAYDMPGLTVGVAGNSEGKLFSVMSEQVGGSAPTEAKAEPCPAELRVAGSGRVTCMAPPPAGGMIGGSNPHGGMSMPPAMGENPHGAVGTKPGVANPHAGAGEKTPPKK